MKGEANLTYHSIFTKAFIVFYALLFAFLESKGQAGTGGTITQITINGYDYYVHTFTSSGTFTPPAGVSSVEYLVVGGGGGGGGISASSAVGGAGGGGAGGYLSNIGGAGHPVIPNQSYSVIVGSGGLPGTLNNPGGNGGSSSFLSVTALGGGGGASQGNNNGQSGASGGGGRLGGTGGSGTSPQGNTGGDGAGGSATTAAAGGGGGSASAGSNGVNSNGGAGGSGTANAISGTSIVYAAGGKGGDYFTAADGIDATANTGNGGTGADGSASAAIQIGGSGGSGIVIVRYQKLNSYRSQTSGDWNVASTWQRYNGSSWENAADYPQQGVTVAPVVEATSTYQTGTTLSSHTITLPSGTTAGDLLLIIFRPGSTETASTPAGYTLLNSRSNNGNSYIWYKEATSGETNVTITTSASVRAAGIMYRISGWYGTPESAVAATNVNNPPSITPSWGTLNTLHLAVLTNRRSDSNVTGAPSGFSGLVTIAPSSSTQTTRARVSAAQYAAIVDTQDPGAFTTTGTIDNPHSFTIAIRPRPAVPLSATIQSSHTVTVTANQAVDEVVVEPGGTLTLNSGIYMSISSGSDLHILEGGLLNFEGESYLTGAGNLEMADGSTMHVSSVNGLSSSGATGNVRVTGSRNYGTNCNYAYDGTTGAQNSGNGLSSVSNLYINNSSGLSLSAPLSVYGTVDFTSGSLTTTASNVLIIENEATNVFTSVSTTKFVIGPMRWKLQTAADYTFPVGKGTTYLPFGIQVTSGADPYITVEAFTGNAGGTAASSLVSMSTTEYWSASVSSGTYTEGIVSLTRQAALGSLDVIARSATQTGTYASLLGEVSGTSIIHSASTGSTLNYFRMAEGRKIQTGTIASSSFCPGESVSVPYTIYHTANAGNVFTAQISNSSGSFSSPVSIGTVTSTSSGTISATIPAGTATGSGYRIRVVGSNPVIGGTDNGTNLAVTNTMTAPTTTGEFICIGTTGVSVTLSASGAVLGDRYKWYSAPSGGILLKTSTDYLDATYSTTVSGATSFYVSKLSSVGCESALSSVLAGYPPASDLDQEAAGTDSWIGHVYDGTNFDTYYGTVTESESFDQSFGGNTYCYGFTSEHGNNTISSDGFSIKYRMNSTRHGLYSISLGSNDGARLTVDGTLLYDDWTSHTYTEETDVLIALNDDSELLYEYYDNTTANRVSFGSLNLILSNTLTTNISQSIFLGDAGSAISGDEYGTLPSGIEISGSGYQWSYSTTPDGPRTILYGAISATYTPNTTVAPFNSPGTYYLRRNGVLLSNNNISPSPSYATCESNAAVISVYAALENEFRSVANGTWNSASTWEQKHANGAWSNHGNYPTALAAYQINPVIRGTSSSAKTTTTSEVHTITLPGGIQSGDLIVIFFSEGNTVATNPLAPSGFTELISNPSGNLYREIWYKVADGSEGTSVTTANAFGDRSAHVVYVFESGTYSGIPYISAADNGTDNSPNPPACAPLLGVQKYFWIAAVLTSEVGTYTLPANYGDVVAIGTTTSSTSAAHAQVITSSRFNEALSEDPAAYSLGGNAAHTAYTLAILGGNANPKSKATVRSGHTVTVAASQSIDTVVINSGGILRVNDGISFSVTTLASLTVQSGGTLGLISGAILNGAGNYIQEAGGTLEVGSPDGIAASGASGNIQNTGTRTYTAGGHFVYNGGSSQVTGAGLTASVPANLTINNSFGVSLSAATAISGTLTLTSGKLITSTSNLLTLQSTATGAVSGGSSGSFVDGPLCRTLPASLASGTSYAFPVGDGSTYLPFTLVNPVTGTGSITATAEAVLASTGGTFDTYIGSLSTSEYWKLITSGNFTSSGISLERAASIAPLDGIAGSTTLTGTYTSLGGTSIGTYGVSNSMAIGSNRFFTLAKRKYHWTGSVSTDWFTSGNWYSNTVPGSSSTIVIPQTINKPVISGISSVEVRFGTNSSLSLETDAWLTLSSGPLLVFEASTAVTTAGTSKIILESGSRYVNLSSSSPKLEVRNQLTGIKGWRNVSSPVSTTYQDLFDNLVTQNFTGSSFPLLQPNLLWWDETNIGTTLQGWRQPSNITNSTLSGRGHFHYVFNGAGRLNDDGTPSGQNYPDVLPITMNATGTEPSIYGSSFTFSPFTYTLRDDDPMAQDPQVDTTFLDINVADAGWNLIGNPTASTLNWDAASGWTKTHVDNTIYVWDPNTNSGEYLTWNGSTGTLPNGKISPFQAFWVHANAASPVLTFTNAVKSEAVSDFVGKSSEIQNGSVVTLNLSGLGMATRSFISFSDDGITGVDSKDAYRLEPMTTTWLGLYMNSSLSHSMPLVINNISPVLDAEMHIPLYVQAMQENQQAGGEFNLSWELPVDWPANKYILLMDHELKTVTDMQMVDSYDFTMDGSTVFKSAAIQPVQLPERLIEPGKPSAFGSMKSTQGQRFSIVLEEKTGDTPPGYRESVPLLLPAMPNPFRESTRLRFRMPEAATVEIQVYDQLGHLVALPVSGEFPAGLTEVEWNAGQLKAGVYMVRMISGEQVNLGRIVLTN